MFGISLVVIVLFVILSLVLLLNNWFWDLVVGRLVCFWLIMLLVLLSLGW